MISVIIAAAGSGSRMSGSVKKQYRKVENLTVLEKTVKAFCTFRDENRNSCDDFEFVIAGPKEDLDYIKSLVNKLPAASLSPEMKVVAGGDTRGQSVQNALAVCTGDYVLIHDAARCFVSHDVIGRVVDALLGTAEAQSLPPTSGYDAVIPCVKPKSTIRTAGETLNRDELFEVQTPQGFKKEILIKAFEKANEDGFVGTDEGSLIDHLIAANKTDAANANDAANENPEIKITIVEGDYKNIKITTEDDMPEQTRIGYGYDVHKLVEGRKLMLGCTEVPHTKGLLGHSDADVLVHAIADALLGAAGLRDIGYYFPDNAKETEGMPGSVLLQKTLALIKDAGYTINNIDGTIVAQSPKLSPYIEEMRKQIASVLQLELNQVAVKATTEEGLGITGTGDAMAAHAVCTLK